MLPRNVMLELIIIVPACMIQLLNDLLYEDTLMRNQQDF